MASGALGFPTATLIPKAVTGVERFLKKHPQWDGRGVTIAVLDTGIDPAANNLQETTEGRAKILDIIDATGSGDVDTSCVRRTDAISSRNIRSLDGKILDIPDEWCNPTGEWHIGLKHENELVPVSVRIRTKEKFMTDVWNPRQSKLKAQALRKLDNLDFNQSDANFSMELKLRKDDLEAEVEILDKLSNKIFIPGATLHCIVFHDGHSWSVAIVKCQDGGLEYSEVIKPYVENGETMKLGDITLTVNVYDEGNMASLVTAGGAHGTHVASIIAAYDSNCQDASGVAPGSQIISVKIGDSRLGTMETASSLIRACSVAVSCGADIVNFSYGEASHWANKGAVLELMSEMCQKYNIIFVASAGNNGPALSTVGCPGGNTSGIIGVGAFVTPTMMCGEYSMTHTKPGLPYTWSSRGPATDGDIGVCVTAPGGAITSVPVWTQRKKQLMNGTSMSSPHVSGCIALILSALKSDKIPYSPALMKKVIENTATPLGKHDPFSVGHGVIQVDKAFEAAKRGLPSSLVDLQVTVSGGSGRGIYLREPHEVEKLYLATVTVKPIFMPKAETEEKASFELKLALLSSKSWVLSPNHLIVWNGARQIKVEVEPRNLPSGVHFAEVMAYVPDDERGPLFRIPVTVVIPDQLTSEKKGLFSVPELRLEKDFVKRLFFHVPKEASWADLKLSNIVCECKTCITVHTVQIVPGRSFRENENKEQISAENNGSSEIILSVVSGYTMELCLSLYWSELRDVTLSVEVLFRCIHPSPSCLTFNSSNMWTSVNVTGFMREEEVFPEFKLTHRIVYKRPTSHKISPLGSRDVLPSGVQIYQLVLSYMFQLNQTTEVRPEFPLMSDLLYENPYSGQLWMVFNCNKQYKCAGDSYSRQYTTKLDKDDYILRLQVCHSKLSELKKLTDMPLCLHSKLSSSLSLEVTASRYDLMSGPTVTKKTLRPGISTRFYLRSLPEDKLAKCGVDQGDFLSGHFTFSKCDKVKKKVAYELKYIVGPRKSARSPSVSTEKKLYTNDSLKEFKINSMRYGVLTSDELEDEYGDDISFLLAKLRMVSESEMCSYSNAEALAASIYAKIDLNEILAQLHIQEQFSHVPGRECFEEKKRQLVECLTLEGSILFKEQPSSDRLKAIYVDLHKLLDKKDKVLKEFKMKYAEAMGHFATLAKMIEEEMSVGRASRDLDEKLIQCYRQLECKEYADLLEHNLTWKYPPDFVSF